MVKIECCDNPDYSYSELMDINGIIITVYIQCECGAEFKVESEIKNVEMNHEG